MSCFSFSLKNSGKKSSNFSLDTLAALRAAVPDTPPLVTIVRNSRFGYLVIPLVRDAISLKSSSFSSLAPIIQSTSDSRFSLAVLYISWIGGLVDFIYWTLNGRYLPYISQIFKDSSCVIPSLSPFPINTNISSISGFSSNAFFKTSK